SPVSLVISVGKPQVPVPGTLIGLNRRDAKAALDALGLKVRFEEVQDDAPLGQVVRTDPAAGVEVSVGATVTAYYSDGPETVPDVIGMTAAEAEQAVRDAGFDPVIFESNDTTAKKGTVFKTNPGEGETAPQGSTVTIFVSTYEPPPPTPTPTLSPSPSASPSP
ncbi:MAG: PASTA domain-containing protein, partial [Nocardioides sp.]